MDIVYIFNGIDSEALKYSMRSIAKNGINVGRVWLLSQALPTWCNPETVTLIPYTPDPKLYKQNDMINAWFTAIDSKLLPNVFLQSDDDYFYIKPVDFDQFPLYVKGVLPNSTIGKEAMGGTKYVRSLVNTRALLEASGLGVINYEQHCCCRVDCELAIKYRHLFQASYLLEYGTTFNSIMGNVIMAEKPYSTTTVKRKDNKVTGCADLNDLKARIFDDACFSATDDAMNYGVRKVLKSLFPDKCKYEK